MNPTNGVVNVPTAQDGFTEAHTSKKDALLRDLQHGLADKTITENDVVSLLSPVAINLLHRPYVNSKENAESAAPNKKLNVIDILFYMAGLIFFAALMVAAFQAGADIPSIKIIVTLGTGILLWTVTYVLGVQPNQSDVRKGLINSLLLTGSLAVVSGGLIAASEAAGNQEQLLAYAVSITLVLLGIAHLVFDKLFRHIILIVFGVLLLIGAFPAIMTALLMNADAPPDVWALISIATGFFVAYGGRLASRTATDRHYLKDAFDSLAAFIILGSIYFAAFGSSIAPIWEIVLPLTIYGAFFISIKRKNKNFLITGSLFLVLFLITVSFKYFSGLGVSFCLVISAVSLLATAYMAANINKKYIKTNF